VARYALHFAPAAARQLERLDRPVQLRLKTAIDRLADDPRPPGCVALAGEGWPSAYRVRVGDHRVIYSIEDRKLVVLVIRIGHRREVYR
jgi:mRNA interferase RelE/StbE